MRCNEDHSLPARAAFDPNGRKEAGSGNVITERTEIEAKRQLARDYTGLYFPGSDDFLGWMHDQACCAVVLEANLNSNVIGVAHIGWISRDPMADNQLKGRHAEYGHSVEDLMGVFSIEKFIQLWGSSTWGAISVDWLPCM
jgi:hypothetical protein